MEAVEQAPTPRRGMCSPIIDLRQYTLYPGTRDAFIELFDGEFVETQEAAGMRIIAQFRDLGDPNRFVWMRGFPDMPSRKAALTNFYLDGSAWKTHSGFARSMMIDSTDALLLRPSRPHSGFLLPPPDERPSLDSSIPEGIVVATIYHLPTAAGAAFTDFYESAVQSTLVESGASVLGCLVTEHGPNNFPRLVMREDEDVFVAVLGFSDLATYHAHMTTLGHDARWRSETYPALLARIRGRPQTIRLSPTSRSQLRAS